MQSNQKGMEAQTQLNNFLESISKLPLDDQLMISEIIHKRVIEAKRKELAESVKESKEEYFTNKTGRGSAADFLNELAHE